MAGFGALAGHEASAATFPWLSPDLPEGTRGEAHLVQVLGKRPLIQLSDRPPNLETPIQAFRTAITPNDQFFVRYHLAGIPDAATLEGWKLEIGGDAAERPVTVGLQQLNDLPQTEITAVCQCSGNRRGLCQPHVPGVQWGYGAMGCATWHGPKLRDVLTSAGVKPEAVEIWLNGLDEPVLPTTPAFHKSLPLAKALADETIIATSMNGGPLPLWNGYPARLIVPGWTSTYWMKHLSNMTISSKPIENFWMTKAYRVPAGMFPVPDPFTTQNNAATWPITAIVVNSLIASPIGGEQVDRSGFTVSGVAWDSGSGIARVDVSLDGGGSWQSALLDRELGRFAFRTFGLDTGPLPRGTVEIRVRATSNSRETQPDALKVNPSGYHNNVPQRLTVTVT
jgi:sulfite dehydrogenase